MSVAIISTSIKLATWALGKYSKGGVKMLYFEYLYLTRFYRISSNPETQNVIGYPKCEGDVRENEKG